MCRHMGEPHEEKRRLVAGREPPRESVRGLAFLDEALGREFAAVLRAKRDDRGLRLRNPFWHRRVLRKQGKARSHEARENRPRPLVVGGDNALGSGGHDDTGAHDLARRPVHEPPTVAPEGPALLDPGGGCRHAHPEAYAACRELTLDTKGMAERRGEHAGSPALLHGGAKPIDHEGAHERLARDFY